MVFFKDISTIRNYHNLDFCHGMPIDDMLSLSFVCPDFVTFEIEGNAEWDDKIIQFCLTFKT